MGYLMDLVSVIFGPHRDPVSLQQVTRDPIEAVLDIRREFVDLTNHCVPPPPFDFA
jgi:hypothetical protein